MYVTRSVIWWRLFMFMCVSTTALCIYRLARRPEQPSAVNYKSNSSRGEAVSANSTAAPTNDTKLSYSRCDDDEAGITIYGKVSANRNYSVFSSTVHNEDSLNYLFALPLTALAWQRVGFDSIVLLAVDRARIVSGNKLDFVLSALFRLRAVVVVLTTHHNHAVMISQVSRLFVPYLISSACVENAAEWEDTYVVTSDADLWPLTRDAFLLPDDRAAILCLNAFCCGDFRHDGKAYSMLPLGNIGMAVKTWRSVARRRGYVPADVDDLVVYFSREFGEAATDAIQKGENLGWYMDQRMITVLIADWAKRDNNAASVRYVRRDVGRDRIDRTAWRPLTLDDKVDAHILESAYLPEVWRRLEALLVLMYDEALLNWCRTYAMTFLALT